MTDDEETYRNMRRMKRHLWIRRKQDDAYFARHRHRFAFWDWLGGWFGMDSYYDSRHQ